VVRRLGALIVLVVGLIGVPIALALLGGNPWPASLSWDAVTGALLQPDDGTVLLGLITVVGWAAWLVFAVSVLVELVSLVSGYRVRLALPGLGGPQRLAASLLVAVFALAPVGSSSTGYAEPVGVSAVPAPTGVVEIAPGESASPEVDGLAPQGVAAAAGHGTRAAEVTHVVELGDDLWSLAERYYGRGPDWRKIARANPHVLTGGPDKLLPGWRLAVPGVHQEPAADTPRVIVRPGETLSSIAERELGAESEWPVLYQTNQARLEDPDELDVGTRLALPGESVRATSRPDADRSGEGPEGRRATSAPAPGSGPQDREPVLRKRPSAAETPPSDRIPASGEPAEARPSSSDRPSAEHQPPSNAALSPIVGPQEPSANTEGAVDATTVTVGLTGVGALLAAGLVAGLGHRRRLQLQARPLGRRIVHPSAPAQRVEAVLGRRQQPMGLRTLDLAVRAISAHCLTTTQPVPRLLVAALGEDELELVLADAFEDPPAAFVGANRSWRLTQDGADRLRSGAGARETLRPYPSLVTLGTDDRGRVVLADLESLGLLSLHADRPEDAAAILTAMALELAFSPWADEMILTLAGEWPDLPAALDKHNVSCAHDVDALLDRLEQRAAAQRTHQPLGPRGHVRIDPDLADPWAPEVVLVRHSLTAEQQRRLRNLLTAEPRPTLAAVTVAPLLGSLFQLRLPHRTTADSSPRSRLEPLGLDLVLQRIEPTESERVVELVRTTAATDTTPAPWWMPEDEDDPDPPPDNVTGLGRRSEGWGAGSANGEDVGTVAVRQGSGGSGDDYPPLLQLLGPVELLDAAGVPPSRAGKQCLEYCGWLLEHPGTTAQAMAAALVVAEGTRRSNMSRLRTWLGSSAAGEAYLPDAYTGRIRLHPAVSSDWLQLQLLTAPAVNRASDRGLRLALELVRGAPLADAAPGQWHWAEELRTDMISAVRDIGVELAERALLAGDLDLARWAAARGLVAAPGDELLLAARVRTEHLAGNAPETERLALHLAAQARVLGVDLNPATVSLLQEVMEGRVRARMA